MGMADGEAKLGYRADGKNGLSRENGGKKNYKRRRDLAVRSQET